jgi:hypothetical protein
MIYAQPEVHADCCEVALVEFVVGELHEDR